MTVVTEEEKKLAEVMYAWMKDGSVYSRER